MERIKCLGKSYLVSAIADRVGVAVKPNEPTPSVNVDPVSVVKPVIPDVKEEGVIVMKCDDDMVLLDQNVIVIVVKNGVCSDEAIEYWEMDEYVQLRELIVGDECFQYVKDLRIVGLNALEKVEIGKKCFCNASGGVFEMRDCEKLESVKIGDGSFVGVVSVVFESECFVDVVME